MKKITMDTMMEYRPGTEVEIMDDGDMVSAVLLGNCSIPGLPTVEGSFVVARIVITHDYQWASRIAFVTEAWECDEKEEWDWEYDWNWDD